ncbi:MAG: hypothetical protein IJK67_06735 [Bacilli bacterium]|nr:hypothetical protein [Bacilli bacterium]
MKKNIIICVLAILMCLLLVGCGEKDDNKETNNLTNEIDQSTYTYSEDDDIYGDGLVEEYDENAYDEEN